MSCSENDSTNSGSSPSREASFDEYGQFGYALEPEYTEEELHEMEAAESSRNQDILSNPRQFNTDWCSCTKCIVMPLLTECLCCHEFTLFDAGPIDGLTIDAGDYIYSNTCNNITCYYQSAIDERITSFTVTTANGNRLFSQDIIYIISSNVCTPDGNMHCTDTGICWCNPNGLSTRICYNHVSDGEGQLTLGCSTGNQHIETFATIAAGPTEGLTIVTAEYIYPITCNNITCYYESAFNERTTVFLVIMANGNNIFTRNIIQIVSSNVCVLDRTAYCNHTGICWCDPQGLSTLICYNHTSGGEGQLTLQCALENLDKESLATIADGPIKVILTPNETSLLVNVGSDIQNIKCKADCHPDCTLTWISPNGHEESTDILTIKNIQINQTGMYKCNASNEVSHMVSAGVTITIVCSARSDQRYQEEPVDIAVMENEDMNITVFLLAYPKPMIIWSMKSYDTGQDYTVKYNNSFNNVEHISTVNVAKVSTKDYGVYTIVAYNNIGPPYVKSFTVKPQGPPEKPTYILVTCEITSMIVSWRPGSNGGFEQTFKVAWLNTITQRTDYSPEIKDSGQELIQQYIVRSLYPETMYVIHVEATNKHGIVISTKNANCTTGLGMFIVLSC
ncbi:unnamed protein product [Mytilus edulis]|uniref:Uncharacterized protein n=1 Tax=Mytilus edulis TaxID=6550 RepID=A0A8S3TY54_MYTED|nr:unnamed protein product [Mytilus edulis]